MTRRDLFFKWLYYSVATLLLILLQSTLLPAIRLWGVHPFLPPMLVAIAAMLEGPLEGCSFAAVFGLLCDITMPGVIPCFYTLVLPGCALPAAMIARRRMRPGYLCALLSSLLAMLLTDLLQMLLMSFQGGVNIPAALSLSGRECLVTVLLSPLVYLLLRSVSRRVMK